MNKKQEVDRILISTQKMRFGAKKSNNNNCKGKIIKWKSQPKQCILKEDKILNNFQIIIS